MRLADIKTLARLPVASRPDWMRAVGLVLDAMTAAAIVIPAAYAAGWVTRMVWRLAVAGWEGRAPW